MGLLSFAKLNFIVDHAEEVEKESHDEKSNDGEGRVGSYDAHFAAVLFLVGICQHSQDANGENGINDWPEVALVRSNYRSQNQPQPSYSEHCIAAYILLPHESQHAANSQSK